MGVTVMIERLLNQTAQWKKKNGINQYGEPSYGDPTPIKCRWEFVTQDIMDRYGNITRVNASVFTTANVQIGDVLIFDNNSYEITNVIEGVNGAGKVVYREVLCK